MDDLVIRNARIIDGTGKTGFSGDVTVSEGVFAQVGGKAGSGRREIDADGCIVTPGFIDVHTHYDAQVRWDPYLSYSSWNGVTSVVMGNCGVGFAPARPENREWLMALMAQVEEIPIESLRAGLEWEWETFPDYLNALDRRRYAIDIGVQVPHAAVRAYVMGERGMDNAIAREDELRAMEHIVREAMAAGALGMTANRTVHQRAPGGGSVPGYGLPVDEVIALGRAAGEAGHGGVIGLLLDFEDPDAEMAWMRRLQAVSGLPVFFPLFQLHSVPERFEIILSKLTEAVGAGASITAQFTGRPHSYLMGLMSTRNPFWERPSYAAIARLPLAERVARMRDPEFRRALLAEKAEYRHLQSKVIAESFHTMFRLGDPPDYEPPPEKSIAALAKSTGKPPQEIVYDMMLERDGQELIYIPVTDYASGDATIAWRMLHLPGTLVGQGDGGAHLTRVCDATIPTTMLTHWARDRSRGPKLSVEQAVQKITSAGAAFFGLRDRGVLAPGMKADINVIDFERLRLRAPELSFDQPAGGYRLVQRADGYVATIVSGTPTFEEGVATGELPGRLIRSRAV